MSVSDRSESDIKEDQLFKDELDIILDDYKSDNEEETFDLNDEEDKAEPITKVCC